MREHLIRYLLIVLACSVPSVTAQNPEVPPTPNTESPSDLTTSAQEVELDFDLDPPTDDFAPGHGYFPSCCAILPQLRAPNMIGDYFGGYRAGGRGSFVLDRLSVIANDLDSPAILPPGGSTLSITESGPIGIFSSSLANVQQLQQLLEIDTDLNGERDRWSDPGTWPQHPRLDGLYHTGRWRCRPAVRRRFPCHVRLFTIAAVKLIGVFRSGSHFAGEVAQARLGGAITKVASTMAPNKQ